jgi:hypothetical protein
VALDGSGGASPPQRCHSVKPNVAFDFKQPATAEPLTHSPSSENSTSTKKKKKKNKSVAGAGRPSSLSMMAGFLIYFLSKTDLPINDRYLSTEDSRASLYTGTNGIFTLFSPFLSVHIGASLLLLHTYPGSTTPT